MTGPWCSYFAGVKDMRPPSPNHTSLCSVSKPQMEFHWSSLLFNRILGSGSNSTSCNELQQHHVQGSMPWNGRMENFLSPPPANDLFQSWGVSISIFCFVKSTTMMQHLKQTALYWMRLTRCVLIRANVDYRKRTHVSQHSNLHWIDKWNTGNELCFCISMPVTLETFI